MTKYKNEAGEETENKRNLLCISSVYKGGIDSIRENKTELRTWKIVMFLQKKRRKGNYQWERYLIGVGKKCYSVLHRGTIFSGFGMKTILWDKITALIGLSSYCFFDSIPDKTTRLFALNRHPNRSYRLVNNMKQSPFKERRNS